jgi:hypothetical protein
LQNEKKAEFFQMVAALFAKEFSASHRYRKHLAEFRPYMRRKYSAAQGSKVKNNTLNPAFSGKR